MVHVWKSVDNMGQSVLSFYPGVLRDQTQVGKPWQKSIEQSCQISPSVLEALVLIVYKNSMAQKMGRYGGREEVREVEREEKERNEK